jgi:hypothetical protein
MRRSGGFIALIGVIAGQAFLSCGGGGANQSGNAGTTTVSWPSCSYEDATSGTFCGCDIRPPIDLTADVSAISIWPFGVHAQSGHTEGHRGLDFSSSAGAVNVYAPAAGTIYSIDNAQDSSGGLEAEYDLSDSRVHFTTINLDCGLQIRFIPLKLVDGIEAGVAVSKGQLIGALAQMKPPYGPNVWSSHFETDAKTSTADSALSAVCPTIYYSANDVTTLSTMLSNSNYSEKFARTVSITCESGGSTSMTYSAENQLCNPRLSTLDRSTLAGCLPSKGSSIW